MSAVSLSARLPVLLPAMTGPQRQAIAMALSAEMHILMLESWSALLRVCASKVPPGHAAALHEAAFGAPDADLLLRSLDRSITPAMLLALPIAGPAAFRAALLAHPRASVREQALDALADPQAGRAALGEVCTVWSRRTLAAELAHMPDLTHAERLALQEELLDPGGSPATEPEPQTLAAAFEICANRHATTLLAARAGATRDAVEAAVALRDRRGLLSLCREADCGASETLAALVQLARISPDEALDCCPDPLRPVDDAAMRWRIGILQGG